jgi:N6-adenosine-specific RNA methylase IME4
LWVTNRSLPKAFRLIEAWGFRYITCLTWVKPSIGMGNYFRGSTEQVLFAVKGSQMLKRRDVGTHFEAKRGDGHSAKPDEFYSLVESCSYGPYIDVFGRKERDGWTVWGENS